MFIPLCIGPVVGVLYNGCAVIKCKYTGLLTSPYSFARANSSFNFTNEEVMTEYCGGYVGVIYLISRDGLRIVVKPAGAGLGTCICVVYNIF